MEDNTSSKYDYFAGPVPSDARRPSFRMLDGAAPKPARSLPASMATAADAVRAFKAARSEGDGTVVQGADKDSPRPEGPRLAGVVKGAAW